MQGCGVSAWTRMLVLDMDGVRGWRRSCLAVLCTLVIEGAQGPNWEIDIALSTFLMLKPMSLHGTRAFH